MGHPGQPLAKVVDLRFIQSIGSQRLGTHLTHLRHPGQPFGNTVGCGEVPKGHSTAGHMGGSHLAFCKHNGQPGHPFDLTVGLIPPVQTIFAQIGFGHSGLIDDVSCATDISSIKL